MTEPGSDVLAEYAEHDDKGVPLNGYRLTILTPDPTCSVGQTVRVFHVCESLASTAPLRVMGPKPVWDEYEDGSLTSEPLPAGEAPLWPASYDGRVVAGPGIDSNYEVTDHRFETPGVHDIVWRPGPYTSNTLRIQVEEA